MPFASKARLTKNEQSQQKIQTKENKQCEKTNKNKPNQN